MDCTRTTQAVGIQALRFGLVGLSGVIVNVGLFSLLYHTLRWPLIGGLAMAGEAAMVSNFLLNDRWTFGRRRASLQRLARFNLSSLGGLAIAAATTVLLVGAGVPYVAADLVGVAGGAGCNFIASACWIWRM